MPLSLKSVLTSLLPFRRLSFARSGKQEDGFQSAEASRMSGNSLSEEVMGMFKIGERIVVPVKVIQIVETENGIHYVVIPVNGDYYNSMKIRYEDVKVAEQKEEANAK